MIRFDIADNVVIVDGVRLVAHKGFPPASEANSHSLSKNHYVRQKGMFDVDYKQCVYSYTYEAWFYADTGKSFPHPVEFWY